MRSIFAAEERVLWRKPGTASAIVSIVSRTSLSVIGNILRFLLAGWWLMLSHLVFGIFLCLTIIGIPVGVGSFKMAGQH
jgi:uncharacterized membrane protein YccF (DUF307 family)